MLRVGGSLLQSNSNWTKRQEVQKEEVPVVATCVDHGQGIRLGSRGETEGGEPGGMGLRGHCVSSVPSGLCNGQD